MAITYDLLLGADFNTLEAAGESWMALYQVLEDQAAALVDLKSSDDGPFGIDHWDGQSGEAARERVRDLVLALDERSAAARRVAIAITVAVEEFKGAQADLNEVVAETDHERVELTDTGSVIPDTSTGTDNIYYAEGLSSRITAALERATEADEALKAAIGTWAETYSESERLAMIAEAQDEAGELQELIDSGATPEQINDWWNGLSEAERLGILEGDPALIAGLDGIPTDTRDAANRNLLDAELNRYSPTLDGDIAALESQIAELQADWDDVVASNNEDLIEQLIPLQDQLHALEAERDQRDALNSLQEAIAGQAQTGQDYFLLGYDSAGDGQAIVSVGNPDTADNTAVYVPGTGADMDGASAGLLDRTESMAYDASQVPGSGETAVVLWLGYDAPDNPVLNSPSVSYAEDASTPLASFMDGLQSTNHDPEGTTTTTIGHSYGTTVIGQSASDHGGLATDQIVAVASPGMTVDHASDLGIDPDDFYATTAPGDMINLPAETAGILGPDPNDTGLNINGGSLDAGFGGTSFSSDNMDGDPVAIHSNYWDPGNPARENMALIFTGNGDQVS